MLHRHLQTAPFNLLGTRRHDRVQHHHAVGRQRRVGHFEEVVVTVETEVLERADRNDAVNRLVELLPPLQQHSLRAWAVQRGEALLDVGLLVATQRKADGVDVVAFDGAAQSGAPAAADIEQRHPWLQAELSQRQVDLGQLGLFQGHVVALEIRAAVGLRRIEEEPEEIVGQVVMRLDVIEVRLEVR